MTDYDLNDDVKQKRYEAFQATEALTSLAREMALLRLILESAVQRGSNRLALDCIKQLSNCAVATQNMLVRANHFIPADKVLALMNDFGQIVLDALRQERLPQPVIDTIVDGILDRIHQRRNAVLLLEDHQHDNRATASGV
jgi:hypothetical protein